MPAHITPLTRNQLLELESLMNALGHDASSRPASTLATMDEDERAAQMANEMRGYGACRGAELSSSPSSACPPLTRAALLAHDRLARGGTNTNAVMQDSHAMLQGRFVDVLRDPVTRLRWRLYDKMLYMVWWSHRPACCAQCGMREAWVPSAESEVRCAHCGAGAGSTEWNDIVEDMPSSSASATAGPGGHGATITLGGGANEDRDEDGDWSGGEDGANGGYGPGEESSQGAVSSYLFFYEWLERVRHILPLDANDDDEQEKDNNKQTSKVTRQGGAQPHLLPVGAALTAVLRAAYDMSGLLVLPGMSTAAQGVVRAGCLYLSLVLHRYAVPFPLYRLGASSSASPVTTNTASGNVTITNFSSGSDETTETLRWVDVEFLALLLGVSLADYFESGVVAAQYLQNVMAVAADYAVPSLLWHPERVPGRMGYILALRPLHSTLNSHSSSAKSGTHHNSSSGGYGNGTDAGRVTGQDRLSCLERLSPEEMAMCVALELARSVDAAPLQHIATSRAAAVLHARRIGHWLDRLGLYPDRRVYRDDVDKDVASKPERTMGDNEAAVVKPERSEEDKAMGCDVMQQQEMTTAAWTTRAAIEDDTFATLCRADDEGETGEAPQNSGTVNTKVTLTTPASPFASRMAYILPSPCANALLHIFARVFHMPALELAEMAVRSGIYRGPTRFAAVLSAAMRRGDYDVLPLARRLSPVVRSCWTPLYLGLHSESRLPLLATLQRLGSVENSTRDRMNALGHVLQKLLRPHGAGQYYQFNYTLRVVDEAERHFNGIYFLSSWLPKEGLATFTCLRSGRKTVTYNAFNRRISLCYLSAKERLVSSLQVRVLRPIVACIEDNAVKAVMDAVTCGGSGIEQWTRVVQSLDRCGRVRRRMRVPMLASRLDALSSIREATAVAQHPIAGAATLLGWGETETILAAPPAVDLLRLRAELQENLFALPFASMLYGLSENRAVAMYASLVALLEYIVSVQARQAQKEAAMSPSALEKRTHGGNGGRSNSPTQDHSGPSGSDKDETAETSLQPSSLGHMTAASATMTLSSAATQGRVRKSRRRRRSAEVATESATPGVTLRTPPLSSMGLPDSNVSTRQTFLTNWVEELLCEEDHSGATRHINNEEEEESEDDEELRSGVDDTGTDSVMTANAAAERSARSRGFTTTTTSNNSRVASAAHGRAQPGLYRRGLTLTPRLSPRRGPALPSPQPHNNNSNRPTVLVRAIALTPPLAPEINNSSSSSNNNTSSSSGPHGRAARNASSPHEESNRFAEEEQATLSAPPPFMLGASTGELEAASAQRQTPRRHRRRRHSPLPAREALRSCVMSYLDATLLPSYGEVLLGQATMPIVCGDVDTVQQQIPAASNAMLSRRAPTGTSAKMPLDMNFTLFQAEECRVRLHRMHRFVTAYKAQKAALWAKARAGTLRPCMTVPGSDEPTTLTTPHGQGSAHSITTTTTTSPTRERKSRRLRNGERSPVVTTNNTVERAEDQVVGSAEASVSVDAVTSSATRTTIVQVSNEACVESSRPDAIDTPADAHVTALASTKSRRMTGRQRRRRERRQQTRREKYGSSTDEEDDEGSENDVNDAEASKRVQGPKSVQPTVEDDERVKAEAVGEARHEDAVRPASIRQRASAQADGHSLAASPSIRPSCEDRRGEEGVQGTRSRPKTASSSPSRRRGRERSKSDITTTAAVRDEIGEYDADADN